MNTKTNRLTIFSLGLMAVSITACTGDAKEINDTNAIPTAPVASIVELDTTIHQDYVANIQAFKNVEIRSRLKGGN